MVREKINKHFPVFKDISFLSVAYMVPTIIAAIFWFYVASLIGVENYGEITYYLTIAGIVSGITMLGTQNSLTVYAAKGEKLLPIISLITFPITVIGAIIVFFTFYNLGASIHVFSYVIFSLITAEFLGRKLFKSYMKITIIQKLLMVTLSILFYYIFGSDGIIIGISLSFVPFITLYYKEFKNTKINFKVLKSKKEFMINNYLLSFTRMFASSIDKIIIMPIFGFAVLGNYALGMQFYMVLLIIPNIIYQYVLPQDAVSNPSIVLKKLTILVSMGLTILGIVFSPIIIGLMFPKFLDAIIIVQIISLGVIPGTINFMYISKFLGDLQNKIVLISSGIFLVTIILGMIFLGKLYDVHGIAASFVLAGTTESVFLIICNKYYKIQKKSNDIV